MTTAPSRSPQVQPPMTDPSPGTNDPPPGRREEAAAGREAEAEGAEAPRRLDYENAPQNRPRLTVRMVIGIGLWVVVLALATMFTWRLVRVILYSF